LVDALEEVAHAKPQDSLQKWLHDIEETVPTLARKLYPALKAQDVQVPLLLDFSKASPSPLTARAADSRAGNR
jgi:indole-3-glycerol phosphate synthase